MGEINIVEELMDIRERLAALEQKVDMLLQMYKKGNSIDRYLKWIMVLWLTFLSALLGVQFKGG